MTAPVSRQGGGIWKSAAVVMARHHWLRVLLALLGACELLLAAGATAGPLAVGVLGGFALIGASLVSGDHRLTAAILITLGTVPFAAVAWTALVPVLLLVVAAGLAIPVLRASSAGPIK